SPRGLQFLDRRQVTAHRFVRLERALVRVDVGWRFAYFGVVAYRAFMPRASFRIGALPPSSHTGNRIVLVSYRLSARDRDRDSYCPSWVRIAGNALRLGRASSSQSRQVTLVQDVALPECDWPWRHETCIRM